MADPVIIQSVNWGHNIPEWANERTQQEVRDLLKAQVQLLDKDGKIQKSLKTGQDTIVKTGKDSYKELSGMRKILNKSVAIPMGVFKYLSDASIRLAQGLLVGGAAIETIVLKEIQRVVEGLKSIPFLGPAIALAIGPITLLTKIITDANEQFKTLFDTGQSLNGSFLNLINYAAEAGLSVQEAGLMLSEFSGVVASITSQTGNASDAFLQLQYNVRSALRPMHMLGLTSDEIANYMGEYLENQRALGTLENLNQMQMASAVRSYIEQLTRLSVMTGKRRDQIADEMTAYTADPGWITLLSTMQNDVKQTMNNILGTLNATIGSDVAQAFKEMMTYGTVVSEDMVYLMQSMPELADGLRNIGEQAQAGAITQDEANAMLNDLIYSQADEARSYMEQYGNQLALMTEVAPGAVQALTSLAEIYKPGELTPLDNITQFVQEVEEEIRQLQQPFFETMAALIDIFRSQGTLDSMTNTIRELLDRLTQLVRDNQPVIEDFLNKWVGKFARAVRDLADWLTMMFDPNKRNEAIDSAKDWIDLLFEEIFNYVNDVIRNKAGEVPGLGILIQTDKERMNELAKEILSGQRYGEDVSEQIAEFNELLRKSGVDLSDGLTERETRILDKLIQEIDSEEGRILGDFGSSFEEFVNDFIQSNESSKKIFEDIEKRREFEKQLLDNMRRDWGNIPSGPYNQERPTFEEFRERNEDQYREELRQEREKQSRVFEEMNRSLASAVDELRSSNVNLKRIINKPPAGQLV